MWRSIWCSPKVHSVSLQIFYCMLLSTMTRNEWWWNFLGISISGSGEKKKRYKLSIEKFLSFLFWKYFLCLFLELWIFINLKCPSFLFIFFFRYSSRARTKIEATKKVLSNESKNCCDGVDIFHKILHLKFLFSSIIITKNFITFLIQQIHYNYYNSPKGKKKVIITLYMNFMFCFLLDPSKLNRWSVDNHFDWLTKGILYQNGVFYNLLSHLFFFRAWISQIF